jgi:TM2 domain-containing membrane protein YozV
MNFLTRNKYWIILIWLISVLVFFKFYNQFYFVNNQSIYFIVSLLVVPVTLMIIGEITYHKNKQKYIDRTDNNLND